MEIKIEEITHIDEAFAKAVGHLVPQLSSRASAPSVERLERVVSNPSAHLFAAVTDDGCTAGMATLIINDIPTVCKAWLEDVVVDERHRGLGIGRALVLQAAKRARECGAEQLLLTSNPSRTAARRLYAECGFSEVATTVFRLGLK